MTRPIRSKEDLQQASNALYYEIGMFEMLTKGMTSRIAGQSVINSALLESFIIHLRVLIDFFYSDSQNKDDIIANDFFSNPDDWIKLRPQKTKLLVRSKKRADKEVAHLTYTRLGITPDEKNWYFEDVYKDMQTLVELFLKSISKDLLGSRWDDSQITGK